MRCARCWELMGESVRHGRDSRVAGHGSRVVGRVSHLASTTPFPPVRVFAILRFMRDFTKLKTWMRAHELALAVYEDTHRFPRVEHFGLTAQLRRSVTSIPSNIAEGAGRATRADYARFLDIAIGSCNETWYQLLLGRELGYLDLGIHDVRRRHTEEVRRMTAGLKRVVLSG